MKEHCSQYHHSWWNRQWSGIAEFSPWKYPFCSRTEASGTSWTRCCCRSLRRAKVILSFGSSNKWMRTLAAAQHQSNFAIFTTVDPSSARTWSYSLNEVMKITPFTSSKQCIHFFLQVDLNNVGLPMKGSAWNGLLKLVFYASRNRHLRTFESLTICMGRNGK